MKRIFFFILIFLFLFTPLFSYASYVTPYPCSVINDNQLFCDFFKTPQQYTVNLFTNLYPSFGVRYVWPGSDPTSVFWIPEGGGTLNLDTILPDAVSGENFSFILVENDETAGLGTVSLPASAGPDTIVVTGQGTAFLSQLSPGDFIISNSTAVGWVKDINSDTEFTAFVNASILTTEQSFVFYPAYGYSIFSKVGTGLWQASFSFQVTPYETICPTIMNETDCNDTVPQIPELSVCVWLSDTCTWRYAPPNPGNLGNEDFGLIGNALRDVFIWLFVPKTNYFQDSFNIVRSAFADKLPFAYITHISSIWQDLSDDLTTDAYPEITIDNPLGEGDLTLIDFAAVRTTIGTTTFDLLKTIMGILAWLVVIYETWHIFHHGQPVSKL